MMNSVLITGATGISGSALVEQYAASGAAVHGTYRDPADDRSWLPDARSSQASVSARMNSTLV